MSKKKKNKKYKNENDKSKKSKKKKNKNKEDKNKRKYFKFYKVLVPFGSGLIAIIGIFIALKEKYREEAILEPRFSLERKINEDGSLTWKIYNSGGEISNAIIYPTMHITFFYENRKTNEDIDITLEVPDYFVENNFGYSTLDRAFYIIDEKENELNEFIEKYTSVTYSEEFEYLDTIISPYFILNYEDYKKNRKNTIYTFSDIGFISDDLNYEIFGEEFLLLEEISEIPVPDIVAPSESDEACVITINYKNAKTQEFIENRQKHEMYLCVAILNLMESKDKPIDEMLGTTILTKDGTLYLPEEGWEIIETEE